MRGDALYRIIGGIVLMTVAAAVFTIKARTGGGVAAAVSGDWLLPVGCLAIALLGALVSVSGARAIKRIDTMTRLIGAMVHEKNRVATVDIAGTVGVHEVEVRERVDEMIKRREIPAGTRIVYTGGEKVVG